MDETTLNKILEDHKAWLEDMGGEQADLHGVDLRGVCLCGAELRKADLRGADLRNADLRNADLRDADLRETGLRGANMREADLREADLRGANMYGADLREANMYGAKMREADLRGADLRDADLRETGLRETNMYGAKMSQKIVQVGPIGSRNDYTIYRVDEDIVQCGCWEEYAGGSLADFIARINETYPEDNEDGMRYRREYLAAIAMFQALRENYLKDSQRECMTKGAEA